MASGEDLRRAFVDAGGRAAGADGDTALERALGERVQAGQAAWPALRLDDVAFVRHLAAHSADGLPPAAHAGDLWLACACALAVPGAAEAFERAFRPFIERAVARVDRSAVDEATQSVLVSLLVAEPGMPRRMGEYAGRAGLKAWVTTVAANATLRLHRRLGDQPHETLSGLADQVAMAEPEIALAKARHARDLDAALRDALEGLEGRQRVILRVRHVKGWRLEQVATMYRVSRATAARMVTAAHESLLVETKRLLRERLRLTDSELESLVALLQSQLEVSLVRLLGETGT
jgi:RNA polymerase sigma-70 factor (ECF subfamily)